jgi:hypothetical protein
VTCASRARPTSAERQGERRWSRRASTAVRAEEEGTEEVRKVCRSRLVLFIAAVAGVEPEVKVERRVVHLSGGFVAERGVFGEEVEDGGTVRTRVSRAVETKTDTTPAEEDRVAEREYEGGESAKMVTKTFARRDGREAEEGRRCGKDSCWRLGLSTATKRGMNARQRTYQYCPTPHNLQHLLDLLQHLPDCFLVFIVRIRGFIIKQRRYGEGTGGMKED